MPDQETRSRSASGALAAFGCFLVWGLVPVFWKQLSGIGALELIAHRVVWSLGFLILMQAFRTGGFGAVRAALRDGPILGWTFVSGGFLTINWLTYVWAVNHGYVIESSLGYFLVPIFNVAIGSLAFRERLRPLQWLAIAGAGAGVVILLVGVGRLPWIALTLAGSWGLYGIMRRQSRLGSVDGLLVETILYLPFAAAYLLWRERTGAGALGHAGLRTHAFLLSVGWVTALPLILFAYGARRIRLVTLGLLQYLTPSIQFLIGLLVYHEVFDGTRFRACLFIWSGLALYSCDSFWAQRRVLRAAMG